MAPWGLGALSRLRRPLSAVVDDAASAPAPRGFAARLGDTGISGGIALVVLTEDSEVCARNTRNFLWVTFTR